MLGLSRGSLAPRERYFRRFPWVKPVTAAHGVRYPAGRMPHAAGPMSVMNVEQLVRHEDVCQIWVTACGAFAAGLG